MKLVTVPEAQARLPELLSAVAAGESVSIRAEDGSLFQLAVQTTSPFLNPDWPGYPKAGSCEGLFVVPDDFKEPRPPRPRPPVTGVPKAGQYEGRLIVPDDFKEPLDEMREYME